jgi:hypothetical protein
MFVPFLEKNHPKLNFSQNLNYMSVRNQFTNLKVKILPLDIINDRNKKSSKIGVRNEDGPDLG